MRLEVARIIICCFFSLTILSGCTTVRHSQKLSGSNNRVELIQPLPQKEEKSLDYIIGSEDVLFISVWQDKDLDTEVIVRPDGKISLQLIREVNAGGKSLAELNEILIKKYSTYIKFPQVLVSVKKFGGNKVIILGQVGSPGVYKPVERIGLLEVIAMAGGFTDAAALNSIIVIRGGLVNPEAIRLNLARAIQETDMSQNIPIQPNDIIYVPKKFIVDINYFLDQYLAPLFKLQSAGD